jgi:hypothetical protein
MRPRDARESKEPVGLDFYALLIEAFKSTAGLGEQTAHACDIADLFNYHCGF